MKRTISIITVLFFFLSSFSFAQSESLTGTKPGTLPHNPKLETEYIPNEALTVIYEQGFNGDNTPAGLAALNWIFLDQDAGGTTTTFSGTVFPPYEGAAYVTQNYQGANGFLIDQWLISPQFTVSAGDTLSYWWQAPSGQWDDSVFVLISQGGSNISDFTLNVGRFKVPQGAWTRYTYVFTTGGTKRVALRYYHTDGGLNGTHSNYWGMDLFQIISGTVSGPGPATNPSPANGATNVPISTAQATWTNPAGATSNSFYFGTNPSSLTLLQSGTLASSFNIPPGTLNYFTTYYWRVDETNAGGTTTGPVWSFTTQQDPLLTVVVDENFEGTTYPPTGWTLVSTVGTTQYWTRQTTASGYGNGSASTRYAFYSSSSGNDQSLITPVFTPIAVNGSLQFDHAYATYTGNEIDRLQLETSSNGGTTWNILITLDGGPTGPLATAPPQAGQFTPTAAQWATKTFSIPVGTNMVRFRALSAFGNNLWLDNIKVLDIIPVELTSFTATAVDNSVTLNWSTATETNNSGFQVERSNGGEFLSVGFVAGYGTTTETKNYSFTDAGLTPGTYTYRLKQVDLNGTFEYSNTVEVDIIAPKEFSLNQNFPNPFNPSTMISFSLAVDSKVSLKVFDILGQEVMTIVNNSLIAGAHEYNFDASNLNTGVYFYRIEASGVDGQNFTSVKKMILTK